MMVVICTKIITTTHLLKNEICVFHDAHDQLLIHLGSLTGRLLFSVLTPSHTQPLTDMDRLRFKCPERCELKLYFRALIYSNALGKLSIQYCMY